jgi:hypothetical protein
MRVPGIIFATRGLLPDPVVLENRVRVVDLQVQAARWYWLIRPPTTGCRWMERMSAKLVIGRVIAVSTTGGRRRSAAGGDSWDTLRVSGLVLVLRAEFA